MRSSPLIPYVQGDIVDIVLRYVKADRLRLSEDPWGSVRGRTKTLPH
jgi:hypothetical protein